MTSLKTALISAAALSIAAPALAGDGYKTNATMTTQTTVITTTDGTAVMGSVETMQAPSKINDTVGEVLQADGEPDIQDDQEIIVAGDETIEDDVFRAVDDDGMIADNAIVVPGSNNTLTTVTCPAGTEAQPDMTCLITGDYVADIDG